MGQYHRPVNLTKKEVLDPHKLGVGLKQWEQLASRIGTCQALFILLCSSNNRGGGDIRVDESLYYHAKTNPDGVVGRWAGDQIAIVGDYSEAGDIPGVEGLAEIYDHASSESEGWLDISEKVIPVIEEELGVRNSQSEGWRDWTRSPRDGFSVLDKPKD